MLSGCVTTDGATDSATGESSNIVMAAAADTDTKQPAEETSLSETDSGEPAPASNPEADAEAAAEAEKKSKKIICKKLKPPTGTRLGGRRICKTKADWEFMYEQNKIYLRQMQQDPGEPGKS
jgi:FtsZ-interacting cell division protein ZipA